MAITKLENLINPEVMGDMINAKIEAQLKLTPYAKVDTSLQGVPGDTKTVPAWQYIGDAENYNENEEIDYTQMKASSAKFRIGKAGKGVTITTEAINSGLGNPIGQAESQLAKSIAGKVDNDVLNAAYGATMIVNKSNAVIGYDAIVDAVTKFEDEEDGIEKVMFIHPKQEATLLKDDDFISADKFTSGVAVNGAIGKIAGCWIKKSRKVRTVDAVEAVAGVYTIEIGGTVDEGDKITIDGTTTTLDSTSGASTTAAATAVATALGSNANYSVTRSSSKLTLTEKSGKEGIAGKPVATIESTAGTLTEATTTEGVQAAAACYKCPIIKMEPDSDETEYTEDELPAITIFLKKDTTVSSFYNQDFDRHEITAYKYYGTALTNAAKVVLAKFGQ